MTQTRLGSLIEAFVNIAIGFWIAVLSQVVIFPLVGIHGVSMATNIEIGMYFTVISLVRSYVLRRWFNARLHRAAEALALRAQQGSEEGKP